MVRAILQSLVCSLHAVKDFSNLSYLHLLVCVGYVGGRGFLLGFYLILRLNNNNNDDDDDDTYFTVLRGSYRKS